MIQKLKDLTLPIAILLGFTFHAFFARLNTIIPFLIFIMLYITLSGIDIRKMKVSGLHLILLSFQLIVSMILYLLLKPYNEILAQGALIIVLTPTAISAPVIAAMLGANLNTMVTSTLLSNLAIVVVAPLYFSLFGKPVEISLIQSGLMVFSKVAPLIVLPVLLALLTQTFIPKVTKLVTRRKNIPFYIWAFSLTIVIGSTIDNIFKMDGSKMNILVEMMLLSMAICALQFGFGRWMGKRYGDVIAGGQSIGQKNTVLSIWMAHTYLHPLSAVVPASYVLWQNLFNSYQIWMKRKKEK